jgi:hypothetical protein
MVSATNTTDTNAMVGEILSMMASYGGVLTESYSLVKEAIKSVLTHSLA